MRVLSHHGLSKFLTITVYATACFVFVSCSSDSGLVVKKGSGDDVGFSDNTDVVIRGDNTFVVTGEAQETCVDLEGACIDLAKIEEEQCGTTDGQADIYIGANNSAEAICYPPKSSGVTIEEVVVEQDGQPQVPQNANNTVLTFAPATDGVVIEDNLRLEAENMALIGNGVDQTIFGGNLEIASNNARIRGLTVEGNLVFEKNANNASVAFCKVKGNLVIKSNDVTVISCQVFGNVEVEGNNTTVIKTGVNGNFNVPNSKQCEENYTFDDPNNDFVVSAEETGPSLSCGP